MLKIEDKAHVQFVAFSTLKRGDLFRGSMSGKLYMKCEVRLKAYTLNAVSLEDAALSHFQPGAEVYPVKDDAVLTITQP